MIGKTFGAIIGLGAASSITALVFAPSLYPASMAAMGGALGGAAVVNESRRRREQNVVEATRVAAAFNGLYEINKGLVSPQQLSFMCGVPIQKTTIFLKALCEQQGGKHIPTERGEVFNFPHPASVLDQLTANAQAWVKSQTDPLLQENATLKTEVLRLNAVLSRQPSQIQPKPLNNSEEQVDPWNKLL
jgi:hypothetical protein